MLPKGVYEMSGLGAALGAESSPAMHSHSKRSAGSVVSVWARYYAQINVASFVGARWVYMAPQPAPKDLSLRPMW